MHSFWPDLTKPAIITPNHSSYLDGPVLAMLAPRPILFGVDPEFSTQAPWRSMLLGVGQITKCRMTPMTPGSSYGLREMLRYLCTGGWVCLFPEGGIETGRSYPGSHWLAERSGASIHPILVRSAGVGRIKIPYSISAS